MAQGSYIYDPSEFIDKETPMFNNMVGIITDQTNRIKRNQELARQKQLMKNKEVFQWNMLKQQESFAAQKQDDQQKFEAQQNKAQNDLTSRGLDIKEKYYDDLLKAREIKAAVARAKAAEKAGNKEITATQKQVDHFTDILQNAGLTNSRSPLRWKVGLNENGQPIVTDGASKYTMNQWEQYVKPRVDFANNVLHNQNLNSFLQKLGGSDKGYSGTDGNTTAMGKGAHDVFVGEDKNENKVTYYGRDAVANLLSTVINGYGDQEPINPKKGKETPLDLLRKLSDPNDSSAQFLYKTNKKAVEFDQSEVNKKVSEVGKDLFNNYAPYYGNLIGKGENPETITGDEWKKMMVNPLGLAKLGKPKTLFDSYKALYLWKNKYQLKNSDDQYKTVADGLNKAHDLISEVIQEYPDIVPDKVKQMVGLSGAAGAAMLNTSEWMKPNPDVKKLIKWPEDDQLKQLKGDMKTYNDVNYKQQSVEYQKERKQLMEQGLIGPPLHAH